jgi:hypothetical protein
MDRLQNTTTNIVGWKNKEMKSGWDDPYQADKQHPTEGKISYKSKTVNKKMLTK